MNDDVPEQSKHSYIPGSQNMPGIPRMYNRMLSQPAGGLADKSPGPSTL